MIAARVSVNGVEIGVSLVVNVTEKDTTDKSATSGKTNQDVAMDTADKSANKAPLEGKIKNLDVPMDTNDEFDDKDLESGGFIVVNNQFLAENFFWTPKNNLPKMITILVCGMTK